MALVDLQVYFFIFKKALTRFFAVDSLNQKMTFFMSEINCKNDHRYITKLLISYSLKLAKDSIFCMRDCSSKNRVFSSCLLFCFQKFGLALTIIVSDLFFNQSLLITVSSIKKCLFDLNYVDNYFFNITTPTLYIVRFK